MCRKRFGSIALLILLQGYGFADEGGGNGFFVGFNTGYTVGFQKAMGQSGQEQQETNGPKITESVTAPKYINLGLQVGYNYIIMDFLGLRGYLDYNYGFSHVHSKETQHKNTTQTIKDDTTLSTSHAFSLNVDVLFNLLNSESFAFGLYAGVGLGYATMSRQVKATNEDNSGSITNTVTPLGDGFILPINLGIHLTANGHHRIDLGFKIPTLALEYVTPNQSQQQEQQITTTTTRNLVATLGYSYIF